MAIKVNGEERGKESEKWSVIMGTQQLMLFRGRVQKIQLNRVAIRKMLVEGVLQS